jgi:uncharacterized protein HemX
MKKVILLIIVLAAGIALGVYFQKQTKAQKIETKAQTDAEQAGDAVKEGVQKVETVATNVAEHVEAGARKAGEVATNAVGEIKQKMP